MKNILNRAFFLENRRWIFMIFIVVVVASGAFLRSYHFGDWLHFELDQSRDVMFVSEGIKNGIDDLPILGPKAGGTLLRLGPAYYYMEYVSGLIFGDTPVGHAMLVLLLSIATLPCFYFLMRLYFKRDISLLLLTIFSFSHFLILYSRFAWNPNILPFFIILGSYALLLATSNETKHPGRWMMFSALLFGIGTQLHFIAFLALPIIIIAYLSYKRPKFSWKTWLGAAAIIFVLYAPVIINDIALNGANSKEFIRAISVKNSNDKSLISKISQDFFIQTEGFAMLLTGDDSITTPKVNFPPSSMQIFCEDACRKDLSKGLLAILFFCLGLLSLLFWAYKEKGRRRDFMVFWGIWLAVVFALFIPLAFKIYPRFFLLLAPMPFIFLGLIMQNIGYFNKKVFWAVLLLLGIILIFINTDYTLQRFFQLSRAMTESVRIPKDNILRENTRVTLQQQQKIVDYMVSKNNENGYPIYLFGEPFWRRSFKYLTQQRGVSIAQLEKDNIYSQSNSFIVLRTLKADGNNLQQFMGSYDIVERKEFGTLTLFHLKPKPEKIIGLAPTPQVTQVIRTIDDSDIPRITWDDIFSGRLKEIQKQKAKALMKDEVVE